MVFPKDAINSRVDLSGNSSSTLASISGGDTYTLLYESMNSGASDVGASLRISCGATRLLQVNNLQAVPQIERFKAAKCTSDIIVQTFGTTASPTTTISIVYVPYDIANMSADAGANSYQTNAILILIAAILFFDIIRRVLSRQP